MYKKILLYTYLLSFAFSMSLLSMKRKNSRQNLAKKISILNLDNSPLNQDWDDNWEDDIEVKNSAKKKKPSTPKEFRSTKEFKKLDPKKIKEFDNYTYASEEQNKKRKIKKEAKQKRKTKTCLK